MAISNDPEFPPLLTVGFHPMDLVALRALCVSPFPASLTRGPIMEGLERLLTQLHSEAIASEVWIDGSFLTQKVDPLDSDIVVKLDVAVVEACTPNQDTLLNAIAESQMHQTHLCHSFALIAYPDGHSQAGTSQWMNAYWIKQFGFSRDQQMKGMAIIKTPFIT